MNTLTHQHLHTYAAVDSCVELSPSPSYLCPVLPCHTPLMNCCVSCEFLNLCVCVCVCIQVHLTGAILLLAAIMKT